MTDFFEDSSSEKQQRRFRAAFNIPKEIVINFTTEPEGNWLKGITNLYYGCAGTTDEDTKKKRFKLLVNYYFLFGVIPEDMPDSQINEAAAAKICELREQYQTKTGSRPQGRQHSSPLYLLRELGLTRVFGEEKDGEETKEEEEQDVRGRPISGKTNNERVQLEAIASVTPLEVREESRPEPKADSDVEWIDPGRSRKRQRCDPMVIYGHRDLPPSSPRCRACKQHAQLSNHLMTLGEAFRNFSLAKISAEIETRLREQIQAEYKEKIAAAKRKWIQEMKQRYVEMFGEELELEVGREGQEREG